MNKYFKFLLIFVGLIVLIIGVLVIYFHFKNQGEQTEITFTIMSDAECQKVAQYYLDRDKETKDGLENASLGNSQIFYTLEDEPILKMYAIEKNNENIGYISISVSYDKYPFAEIASGKPPFNISEEKKESVYSEFGRDVEFLRFIYIGGLSYYVEFRDSLGEVHFLILVGPPKLTLTLEELRDMDFIVQPTASRAKQAHQVWDDILRQ